MDALVQQPYLARREADGLLLRHIADPAMLATCARWGTWLAQSEEGGVDGPAPRGQDLLLPEATGWSWSQCSLAVKSVDTQLVVGRP